MMNLLNSEPDDRVDFETDGSGGGFTRFYFGVRSMGTYMLPKGSRFMVVNSPNPFVHNESPLHEWRFIEFEISKYRFLPHEPMTRSYKQVNARSLNTEEVARFEELRKRWRVQSFEIKIAS